MRFFSNFITKNIAVYFGLCVIWSSFDPEFVFCYLSEHLRCPSILQVATFLRARVMPPY